MVASIYAEETSSSRSWTQDMPQVTPALKDSFFHYSIIGRQSSSLPAMAAMRPSSICST